MAQCSRACGTTDVLLTAKGQDDSVGEPSDTDWASKSEEDAVAALEPDREEL